MALEANFAMAGMGMEPLQLDRDVCAWRTEGSGKAVAMAGNVTLRADGHPLVPQRSFSLALDLAVAIGWTPTVPAVYGSPDLGVCGRRQCSASPASAWMAKRLP